LVGAELAKQLGGGLVGDAEAGAERVAGDRLSVLFLVLGGGPACGGEERLVPGYAVEQGHLASNPVDRIQWTTPAVAASVDRRVVVSPARPGACWPPSGD
jgi:hypothetical protein